MYLYGYFGVGVMVLVVVYGTHHLTKEKQSESLRDLLEAVNPNRKKLSYRIFNHIVTPVLAAIFVVAAWPIVACMKVKDILQRKEDHRTAQQEFAVERENLQERLTVQEIERREVVLDPLKAAPELPFGHLNGAWKGFLSGHAGGGELWSFSARWRTTWGLEELRAGYVVVRDGVPGAHFLGVWQNIQDEAEVNDGA